MTLEQFVKYAKKFCVALVAALGVLATCLVEGMTTTEWITVLIAFLGALGVYQVKNEEVR